MVLGRVAWLGLVVPQARSRTLRVAAALAVQVNVGFEEYSLERAAEANTDVLFIAAGFKEQLYRRLRAEAEVRDACYTTSPVTPYHALSRVLHEPCTTTHPPSLPSPPSFPPSPPHLLS